MLPGFRFHDDGRYFRHLEASRSPPRDGDVRGVDAYGSAVDTSDTMLPIEDILSAGAIALHNAYSERVDPEYDRMSIHTTISSKNDHSAPKERISP